MTPLLSAALLLMALLRASTALRTLPSGRPQLPDGNARQGAVANRPRAPARSFLPQQAPEQRRLEAEAVGKAVVSRGVAIGKVARALAAVAFARTASSRAEAKRARKASTRGGKTSSRALAQTRLTRHAPHRSNLAGQHRLLQGASVGLQPAVARTAMLFERFKEKTIKAVMISQSEARRLRQDRVYCQMLVVGILAEGTDFGSEALRAKGIGLQQARMALEQDVGRGDSEQVLDIPFTNNVKDVMNDALRVALEMGSFSVGTVHVLCAILHDELGNGVNLLQKVLAVGSADEARRQITAVVSHMQLRVDTDATEFRPIEHVTLPAYTGLKLSVTLQFGTDLTALARKGKLDPMIGRKAELERTVRILGRRSKNNPVLLGEPGVGKTAIAYGLAQRIADGDVPQALRGKVVILLDMANVVAGTQNRGDFEERLKDIMAEVKSSNRRLILVIDEIHTIAGAGKGERSGGMDAANLLKPALASGAFQCLGATTFDEYRKHIEKDPALERRFQPVHVSEPSEEEAVQILEGLAPKYEAHHQLHYTHEALVAAVKLASKYITNRHLPDKAIDVMDEAASKVQQELAVALENGPILNDVLEEYYRLKKTAVAASQHDVVQELKRREEALHIRLSAALGDEDGKDALVLMDLKALRSQIFQAVCKERFDEARRLKAQHKKIMHGLAKPSIGARELVGSTVTEDDVAEVVAGWTGIDVKRVGATESRRLLSLEDELHRAIVGQHEAVVAVSRALRRARVGLRDASRPIASFMFCGPTGVGKTKLVKALSENYFGTGDALVRLDMSEFMEKHTVSKLIGSPPGYEGYGDGGLLSEAVRKRPYSLVLLDEVEKAHPDVFNMFLQVLDDGRLTDSTGRVVSFANTVVVMTSNLGSAAAQKGAAAGLGLGFATAAGDAEARHEKISEVVHEELKRFFKPEFLNRIDETVVFRPLAREDIEKIAEIEIQKVADRLNQQQLDLELSPRFKARLVDEGAYGARPLRRAITRMIEDTLADYVLMAAKTQPIANDPAGRETIELDVDGQGKVLLRQRHPVLVASR